MAASRIYVNFLSESELSEISGVGPRIAHLIMRIRATQGNADQTMLEFFMKRPLSNDMVAQLDFTPNPVFIKPGVQSHETDKEQQRKLSARAGNKLFRSVKPGKAKSEPDMDMSDVVSVLVHNLPSVPSHVYTLDDQFREAENELARTQLLLIQVKMDMLTSKMSRDDTVGIDTQPAAIPKVPRQVRLSLRDYAENMGAVQPTAAASRGSYSADTPIMPVPRPRPTPRTTVHQKSYHTVGLHGCSDTATPSRSVLHDALGGPAMVQPYHHTSVPGQARAVAEPHKKQVKKNMTDGNYDNPQIGVVMSEQEQLFDLRKQLDNLTAMMAKMTASNTQPLRHRGTRRRSVKGNCFSCNDPNHIVRDCPKRPTEGQGGRIGADRL